MSNRNLRACGAVFAGLVLGASALLTGCGGDPGTHRGDSVLVEGTTQVAASASGGGFIQIPAGASCQFESSYDLAMASGDLTWRVCRAHAPYEDPASYAVDSGTRTLSAAERAQITGQIRAVQVTDGSSCGADKDSRVLTVDSPAGHRVYGRARVTGFCGYEKASDLLRKRKTAHADLDLQ